MIWCNVMFNLKLFSASALYRFGSSSKKVLSIYNPSINLNRAIGICKKKKNFILVAVFERTLLVVTLTHTFMLYYTPSVVFLFWVLRSICCYMWLWTCLQEYSHISLLSLVWWLFCFFFLHVLLVGYFFQLCVNVLNSYNWMLISIR